MINKRKLLKMEYKKTKNEWESFSPKEKAKKY